VGPLLNRRSFLPCAPPPLSGHLSYVPLQSTKNAELQRKRVLQELGSMLRVQHHPHAVRLLDAFEDARGYHLVMPVLKGEPAERQAQKIYSLPHALSHLFDITGFAGAPGRLYVTEGPQQLHSKSMSWVFRDTKTHCLQTTAFIRSSSTPAVCLFTGGELFEHIGKRAAFTEAAAAEIARSLLQYLAHVHGLGVAHMDIKPENIMFDSQGADGVLKVG